MPTSARVAIAPVSGLLRVVDVELPDPAPGWVVVRQFASGICHSQLHQIHRPRTQPALLGHESTGEVVAVGDGVTHLRPGDVVFVTWVPRNAEVASAGWSGGVDLDLGAEVATTKDVFTWATHTLAHGSLVVKVPPGTARDVTAIIGCAVMTGAGAVLNTARVTPGQSVAVFGVGGVGLSAVVAAAASGAAPIIAVDVDPAKLAFAQRFGATHGVNAHDGDPVAQIQELTASLHEGVGFRGLPVAGVDWAFDCIGHPATMCQIIAAVRPGRFGVSPGGHAVLVGVPPGGFEFPALDVLFQEKSFRGSIGGSCTPETDFPRFLAWYADGRLPLDDLVTERFALDDVNEACAALEAGKIAGRAIFEF
jgi:Zn-dependent alcohol dehydrogenase